MFETRRTNRNAALAAQAQADQSTLESDKTPTYTFNLTTAVHSGPPPKNYIYYRIYAEDGSILSKAPAAPDDPFLGRIKATSVPPPLSALTVKAIKHSIAKAEDIKDRTSTIIFLTPYSESPMGDSDKVNILDNDTAPGSTPQKPLALVTNISDDERIILESGRRGGLTSDSGYDTSPADIRYLYYLLYADDYEIPSKVAIDPEEPCLGRIRADSVAPPHSSASIKRYISRVEKTPAIAHADLYASVFYYTPLKEGFMAILPTDGPGLSPNKPMAIVQKPIVQVESPSILDGRYVIKNRAAADFYWDAWDIQKWDILHDNNGNISIKSPYAPSSWVGADLTGSTAPVPWRLVPAGRKFSHKFYYLTTDLNPLSQNPRVPVLERQILNRLEECSGMMATLWEGNQWQMWEFIRI